MPKSIAILGGAFDPPTANHMLAAAEVIHSGAASEVWLVPCGPRPDKPKLSGVVDRYIMTQIAASTAFSANFPVHVSEVEVHEPEMVPTYDLLRRLREKYSDHTFSLVIGTDWLQPGTDIRQWTSKDPADGKDIVTGDKLLAEFDFLVIPRPGYDVENLADFGPRMKRLEMPEGTHLLEGNLSSTEIRKRTDISFSVLEGPELIEGLVTPAVAGYISRRGLYRNNRDAKSPVQRKHTSIAVKLHRPSATRKESSCFSFLTSMSSSASSRGHKGPRNVAVFGGAFDPPTNSHMFGLAEIIHAGVADEVIMAPCGPRPDKPHLRPPLVRYIMCQLGVNSSFGHSMPISVSDVEVFEPEALATYDSLRRLKERDPDANLMFVIGSDWLQPGNDIRKWTSKCPETGKEIVTGHLLVEEFDFLVIKRPGFEVKDLKSFGPRMKWMELPHGMKPVEANMSSTEIRKRAAKCYKENVETLQLIDGLVPPAVFSYVKRDGIYRS
uniref:Cytidyltransferase-like domain-containing protein n=1 Tax=Alexandrium catenella TaxID=2925 RepID=A0A7S1LRX7_ALECA